MQGATWDYKITGPVSDTFTHTILSVESDGFTEQDQFGTGVTRQGKWQCDDGNLIALNPSGGSSASVSTEGVSVDFETTAQGGVTLPASLTAGDTWNHFYKGGFGEVAVNINNRWGAVANVAYDQKTSTEVIGDQEYAALRMRSSFVHGVSPL